MYSILEQTKFSERVAAQEVEIARLREALEYVRDWARTTSPELLSGVAEEALKQVGHGALTGFQKALRDSEESMTVAGGAGSRWEARQKIGDSGDAAGVGMSDTEQEYWQLWNHKEEQDKRIAELENERESWQAAMKYWRGLGLREHSVNRRLQGVIEEAYRLLNDFDDEAAYNLLSAEVSDG